MNTDLENEKSKFINQVVGKNVLKIGGEVMSTRRDVDYDEIERQNQEDRHTIASILHRSEEETGDLTTDERRVLEFLSIDHEYNTKDAFGELYATNPDKLVAEELGYDDPIFVGVIIDQLVDYGYVQSHAATKLHISDDGIMHASVTQKGREALRINK